MPIRPLTMLLLAFLLRPTVAADDSPQFRGPTGQGLSSAENLPVAWSENLNVAWKTPIQGRGWSSPVIWGQNIWLTTALETAATPEEKEQRLSGNSTNRLG